MQSQSNDKNKKNKDGARIICLPNKVIIKEQTIIKMNLDLSLIACVFGHSFDQMLNDEEKTHEKESNAKIYHIFSRNRLAFFNTNGNAGMTKSHTCKTIPRFHEFVAKSRLADADGCQAIGCAVSNSDAMLNVEC